MRCHVQNLYLFLFSVGFDFEDCMVHLNENNLDKIESSVFKLMLEKMFKKRTQRAAVFLDSSE